MQDPTEQIYKAWPPEVVQESLQTFAEAMRSDAGIAELQNGLHGLDFICRRSELTEFQSVRYEALQVEAEMRISLMALKEAEEKSVEQLQQELLKELKTLHERVKNVTNYVLRNAPSAEEVYFKMYGREMQDPMDDIDDLYGEDE